MRNAVVVTLLAWGLGSCADQPTQVAVYLATDLRVPGELQAVRMTLRNGAGDTIRDQVIADLSDFPSDGRFHELASFGVVPRRGVAGQRFEVEAAALLGGAELFTSRARTGFVTGRSIRLDVYLPSSCREQAARCRPDDTCGVPGCVSPDVDPALLPDDDGSAGIDPEAPTDPRMPVADGCSLVPTREWIPIAASPSAMALARIGDDESPRWAASLSDESGGLRFYTSALDGRDLETVALGDLHAVDLHLWPLPPPHRATVYAKWASLSRFQRFTIPVSGEPLVFTEALGSIRRPRSTASLDGVPVFAVDEQGGGRPLRAVYGARDGARTARPRRAFGCHAARPQLHHREGGRRRDRGGRDGTRVHPARD